MSFMCRIAPLVILLAAGVSPLVRAGQADKPWVVYDGFDGPGKGKHIVLISGDEEYRSEETLPQLGKILAKHHGFKCTVLFAIDPKTGTINPDVSNIPGLEALQTADLMIIFTRFRDLPDEQMKHIVAYLESGKPIIGLRTATHAFRFTKNKTYARFGYNSKEGEGGGFGKQFLGETWVNHYVPNGKGSTRGLVVKGQEKHPILRGIKDGDIWGPSGIYGVRLPMSAACQPLVMGQALAGMKASDPPAEGKYNDPMMPVAWTHTFKGPDGKAVRTFATTMGASQDFASEGLRRLLVNATYWALGMEERIGPASKVELVGDYQPTQYRFGGYVKGVVPGSLKLP
jgi:hypothetical protein